MPGRYSMRRRRSSNLRPVNSIKNVKSQQVGLSGTQTALNLVVTKDTPVTTSDSDVARGCNISRMWITLDACGIAGTGVLNVFNAYLIKNPGDNLTVPDPGSEGTSNEKKFIFKSWNAMIMRNQDGNNPYHWEGWVRIPRVYQRMGTDDRIELVIICTATLTGHFSYKTIYKWFQ